MSHKKKLWVDDSPPESLKQIYESFSHQLKNFKQKLDDYDLKYKINEHNRFKTMTGLSTSLTRLKHLAGISQLNSNYTIVHLIKIINYNIKINKEERMKQIQEEAMNRELSFSDTESISSEHKEELDEEEDEERLKQELKTFFNFSNKISKVIREKQEENRLNEYLNLDKKKYDPLITPLLTSIKRNFVKITPQDEQDLDILIHLLDNTFEAMTVDYKNLIDSIEILNATSEKYFLSFYTKICEDLSVLEREPASEVSIKILEFFDQVIKYDTKRLFYAKMVKKNLYNLRNIRKCFDNGGLLMKHLSEQSRKLNDRFDLDQLQVVLIIPEHSFLLNNCIKILNEWISYDSEYAMLVESDMKVVEKQKKILLSEKVYLDRIYNKLLHRLQLVKGELVDSSAKLKVFFADFLVDDIHLACDARIFFDQIEMYLNKIEGEMNKLNRMCAIEIKKRSELNAKLIFLEDNLKQFYARNKVQQTDLDILETCWFKLKNVYIYKTLSESLTKIYYQLDLPNFKFGLQNTLIDSNEIMLDNSIVNSSDLFLSRFQLVANMIGNDWIKLYNTLPFYPERGLENIKKDVEKIYLKFNRGNSEAEQALCSLKKWKRIHARAKMDDIRDGLTQIGRFDIIKELDEFDKNTETVRIESKTQPFKKSSFDEEDIKKKEADILHQRLVKFFESKNIKTKQFDFKFYSKQST